MISKAFSNFSTKKTGFFWTEINPNVLEAQYAVRGVVPTLATEMQNELQKGTGSNDINKNIDYPFNKITFCNIGNPQ